MALDSSFSGGIPLGIQRQAWDSWNTQTRENSVNDCSQRQALEIERVLEGLGRTDLEIIDVGCGTGWMCGRMQPYGRITGTDLIAEALERAQARHPQVRFVSGSIFDLDLGLPEHHYDVVVTMEVLANVSNHAVFIERLADLLKPGGRLILTTPNRPIVERWGGSGGPTPGRLRSCVNTRELRALLALHFEDISIVSQIPVGESGLLRVINAPKVNKLLALVVPASKIEAAKEKAMLGRTLLATATKR